MTDYTERIKEVLELTKGGRVLHMGCTGSINQERVDTRSTMLHAALVEKFPSVLGADIDRDALAELESQGLEVVYMDAQNIPEEGEKFDAIVAGELIEHLENPGQFLEGARTRLKENGRLVLTTPNAFCPVYFLFYLAKPERHCNVEHTCWYDNQTIRQVLERCGYELEEIRFVNNIMSRRFPWVPPIVRTLARVTPKRFLSTMVVSAKPKPA